MIPFDVSKYDQRDAKHDQDARENVPLPRLRVDERLSKESTYAVHVRARFFIDCRFSRSFRTSSG